MIERTFASRAIFRIILTTGRGTVRWDADMRIAAWFPRHLERMTEVTGNAKTQIEILVDVFHTCALMGWSSSVEARAVLPANWSDVILQSNEHCSPVRSLGLSLPASMSPVTQSRMLPLCSRRAGRPVSRYHRISAEHHASPPWVAVVGADQTCVHVDAAAVAVLTT